MRLGRSEACVASQSKGRVERTRRVSLGSLHFRLTPDKELTLLGKVPHPMRFVALRQLPLLLVLGTVACSDLATDPRIDEVHDSESPAALVQGGEEPTGLVAGSSEYTLLLAEGQSHPGLPAQARAGDRIPDRYIIVFRPGRVSNVEAESARLVRGARGALHYVYGSVFQGFAATIPAQALEGLRRNPNILLIEQDGVVTRVSTTQTNATWGIDRIDQRSLPLSGTYRYSLTGDGARAYILDTGIRSSHTEFTGRMLPGATAIFDGRGTDDCDGHGTHVASTTGGTVYGVAKGVSLVPVRVLNCQGSGTWSGVIAGIDWVAAEKESNSSVPMVANLSLGGGASDLVDAAVNRLAASGVTVVVAAGNENDDACRYSPARASGAITVASTTSTDARSSFSNFGSCVDLFAPGSSITAAWYTSNTATRTISGTSMAAPHVAGAVALYVSAHPDASPEAVRGVITGGATTGVVSRPGRGSPNLLLYTGGLAPVSPDPEEGEPDEEDPEAEDPETEDPDPEDPGPEDPGSGDPDSSPVTIRSFEVSDDSNRNFVRASASWQVAGANLRTVRFELLDDGGAVLDATTVSISGSEASGNNSLGARGSAANPSVRITVTSADGTRTGVKGLNNQWIGEDPTQPSDPGDDPGHDDPDQDDPVDDEPADDDGPGEDPPADPLDLAVVGLSIERSQTGPWTRADVQWAVQGDDLASVQVELLNGTSVVDRETFSVSGDQASGESSLRTRPSATHVRVTVVDARGARATRTESF